jgi:hypothetical protein
LKERTYGRIIGLDDSSSRRQHSYCWRFLLDIIIHGSSSSSLAAASMVIVVGDFEHGWIPTVITFLLLDVLGGRATGVVSRSAPEVAVVLLR